MLFRKEKKCLLRKLSTIVVLFFVLFFTVLNTIDVFAVTKDYSGFKLRVRYQGTSSYVLTNDLLYGQEVNDVDRVDGVRIEVNNVGSVPSDSNFISVTGKVNLVVRCSSSYVMTNNGVDSDAERLCPRQVGDPPHIDAVSVNSVSSNYISSSINTYVTNWMIDRTYPYVDELLRTFTYEYTFVVTNNIPSTLNTLAFFFSYDGSLDNATYDNYSYYFEGDQNNKMYIDFSVDRNTAILVQQTQLQQLTLEALNNMNQGSDTYYNNYYDSVDNIEGQTTSDIDNATSSQTTSIIGTISSFVTALGTVQTGSCELTLPFPQFIGGNTTVNPCTGKDKAPTIVQVGSSMFLIGVFIPFAFMILKMIYNEIRSFTNG